MIGLFSKDNHPYGARRSRETYGTSALNWDSHQLIERAIRNINLVIGTYTSDTKHNKTRLIESVELLEEAVR